MNLQSKFYLTRAAARYDKIWFNTYFFDKLKPIISNEMMGFCYSSSGRELP